MKNYQKTQSSLVSRLLDSLTCWNSDIHRPLQSRAIRSCDFKLRCKQRPRHLCYGRRDFWQWPSRGVYERWFNGQIHVQRGRQWWPPIMLHPFASRSWRLAERRFSHGGYKDDLGPCHWGDESNWVDRQGKDQWNCTEGQGSQCAVTGYQERAGLSEGGFSTIEKRLAWKVDVLTCQSCRSVKLNSETNLSRQMLESWDGLFSNWWF